MNQPVDVIKRRGSRPTEHYAHEKVHASVLAACLSVRSPQGEAETIADRISQRVSAWVHERAAITSDDIRRIASEHLHDVHPDAAYLYKHHQFVL